MSLKIKCLNVDNEIKNVVFTVEYPFHTVDEESLNALEKLAKEKTSKENDCGFYEMILNSMKTFRYTADNIKTRQTEVKESNMANLIQGVNNDTFETECLSFDQVISLLRVAANFHNCEKPYEAKKRSKYQHVTLLDNTVDAIMSACRGQKKKRLELRHTPLLP